MISLSEQEKAIAGGGLRTGVALAGKNDRITDKRLWMASVRYEMRLLQCIICTGRINI